MPTIERAIDANFFNLIHHVAGAQIKKTREQRGEIRRSYTAVHKIAPGTFTSIPEEQMFIPVQCHDLTRNGFSFLLPETPDFTGLVAAFERPDEVIYVAAEITHYEDVLVNSDGSVEPAADEKKTLGGNLVNRRFATPMVLVGCEFTERMMKSGA